MVKSTIKCLPFFRKKLLKHHALKTALQELFRKKGYNFFEIEIHLSKKLSLMQVSFLETSLDFKSGD